jgi:selenocysteine-specific elongation factor
VQVIATAGHVDHGKSTLVRLLTGMEPDRWAEERRRGLTIDLGFAWTVLGAAEIAFVDVPGHERFVPNMLAGIGPVPAVLFVVAADEGWRAQSSEHLAALAALGVADGVLAVTRSDLADPAPALEQALRLIGGTSLGVVPAVAVSGRTGAGLERLRAELTALAGRLPVPDAGADVRLWVDRSFTIRGAGTVVTGTLGTGTMRPGEELAVAGGGTVRVRGVQALGRPRDAVSGVARVAVNLRGVDHRDIGRGAALITPGRWHGTAEIDVALRGAPDPLPSRLVLHLGAAAVPARVRPLGTVRSGLARLLLDRPLPLRVGDRGLLRDPGRHAIAAGITVLDVRPPGLDRRGAAARRAGDLGAARDGGPVALAELAVRDRGLVRAADLAAAGLPAAGTPVGAGWLADPARWKEIRAAAAPAYRRWRAAHPVAAGMPAEVLRQALGLPDPALLPAALTSAGSLRLSGGLVVGSDGLPAAVERAVAAVEADLAGEPFAAPEAYRLVELGLGPKEVAAAARAGRLLRLSPQLVLLPGAPAAAAAILAALPQPFTLSQARQALRTTRRVAVPLLEHLDRAGLTRRNPDDTRTVTGR